MSAENDTTLQERADDYVLGLPDAADSAAIEAEIEVNADLRRAVGISRDRFIELDLAGASRPVSAGLWTRITAAIDEGGDRIASSAGADRRPPTGNDNRLSRWRGTAIAGMAASLLLAVGLGYALLNRPQAQVIAVLVDAAGKPLVLVEDFGNASAKITPLADLSVPADRSMQVWTLPSKEMGPTSLGLLDGWHTEVLTSAALPVPHEEQLYEITLEQLGGSPTGRPTGPILVKGFAKVPR
jgi:anti-sigma-K factor RskA